jgi:hypothetical protein
MVIPSALEINQNDQRYSGVYIGQTDVVSDYVYTLTKPVQINFRLNIIGCNNGLDLIPPKSIGEVQIE